MEEWWARLYMWLVPVARWTGFSRARWATGPRHPGPRAREANAMHPAVVLREGGWGARARRLVRGLSPVAVSPAAPREMVAALDTWGPSLMPRSAQARGVAMGLGIVGTRATSGVAEKLTRMAANADAPLPRQLAAWAL